MTVHRRGLANLFVGHPRMVVVPNAALQPFRTKTHGARTDRHARWSAIQPVSLSGYRTAITEKHECSKLPSTRESGRS